MLSHRQFPSLSARLRAARALCLAGGIGALSACAAGGDGLTDASPAADRLEFSATDLSLASIGAATTLTVTARDAGGVVIPGVIIAWSSVNADIADVSGRGNSAVITARASGATVIRAQGGGVSVTVPVRVLTVRAIGLTPSAFTMRPGESRSMVANVDAEVGALSDLNWSVRDPAIATISAQGVVTALTNGTTVVRATAVGDERVAGSASLSVGESRSLVLSATSADLAVGDRESIRATVSVEPGASLAVLWSSSNASVASVSSSGEITAVRTGSATVRATLAADSRYRADVTVRVSGARSVTVSPSAVSMRAGEQRSLTAAVTIDGAFNTGVTWRTSNSGVATVSSAGVVTGVATGAATVTAVAIADTTRRATASVTVTAGALDVAVSPAAVSIATGESRILAAVVGNGSGSQQVTWRSSNSAIATVSNAGAVTGVSAGSAVVTAVSTADTTRRATSLVTVTNAPRLVNSWSPARLGSVLYEDVLSLSAIDANNAYAVNSIGDVFRWNGTSWQRALAGATSGTRFLAVSASSTTNVLAVGTNGVVVRFNGSTWNAMSSGTSRRLQGVFAQDAQTAFAVGEEGVALRLTNGSSWAMVSTGVTSSLSGIWSSGGTAFAVGAGGVVLSSTGGAFSRATVPATDALSAVSGTSATNVVAVGDLGVVLRFDGTTWSRVSSSTLVADYRSVSVSAANTGRAYLASGDGLVALDGTTLTRVTTPYTPILLSTAIDAGGVIWVGGQRGTVMRSNGVWETISLAPDLIDVSATSATNAWAVGEFGFIFRWNGSSWARQSTPSTTTLNTVWGFSATDAFASGENGLMLRWNGSSWNSMSFPSSANVYSLWGTSASNVYASTEAGEVLRFNGSSWSVVTSVSVPLWSVFGSAANNVFVSGENGTLLRFNGSTWANVPTSTSATLTGVWAGAANALSIVGFTLGNSNGVAFGPVASSINAQSPGTARSLTSVWGLNGGDLYATGDTGTVVRYDGNSWLAMPTGTTDLLWSVSGAPSGASGAFAVGFNSTVLTGGWSANAAIAMARVANATRVNYEPAARATLVRGAMPTGQARRSRKGAR